MTRKILVLASNPQDTAQLLLNREIREIDDALEKGKYRERFSSRFKVAVRVDDLQSSLQKESARIVHFCGHGMGSQGLVLETNSGQQQLLDTQAIADLFKLFANQIECVVLNACYSQVQAAEISKHINYVIGTKREIRDDAAIAFSKGFYQALGNGETIERAYEFGCNRIQLDIYDSSKTPERKLIPVYSEAEELFTLCANLETRGNFIQGLINISQASNNSIKLILAMRSDFLEEVGAYPQFARIAEKNIHLVADMQEGELRQAIEEPAAQYGIVFESGLVEEIIRDVQGQAGSLPLLQYTLDLLWQNDDLSDRELNIVTYRQLGGVTGALQKHVNEIYQGLPPEQKLATKQILLRLVDVVAFEQSEVLRTAVSKRFFGKMQIHKEKWLLSVS